MAWNDFVMGQGAFDFIFMMTVKTAVQKEYPFISIVTNIPYHDCYPVSMGTLGCCQYNDTVKVCL